MFSVTHFRTEFIHQGQAAILRKVTMTQFLLVVAMTALGVGLFKAPLWLAPLFIILGYLAGYSYHGEILLKRTAAYVTVRSRTLVGSPRIVNIQAEWDTVRTHNQRQQTVGTLPAAVIIQPHPPSTNQRTTY